MNTKKKAIIVVLVLILVIAASIGSTVAYFSDKTETKNNQFAVGNIKIELTEEKWDAAKEAKENENMYPGQIIDKDPVVTNIGDNTCYVRIKVSGLDTLGADKVIKYLTGGTVDALGTDWVKGTDGYFYYTKVLEKDAATTALFDQIQIPTSVENWNGETSQQTYSIDVVAEAVQAEGFATYDAAPWSALAE